MPVNSEDSRDVDFWLRGPVLKKFKKIVVSVQMYNSVIIYLQVCYFFTDHKSMYLYTKMYRYVVYIYINTVKKSDFFETDFNEV